VVRNYKDDVNSSVACQPIFRVNSASSVHRPVSVSVSLSPDWIEFLRSSRRPDELLKSVFRVTVAEPPFRESDRLPDVSGRYRLGKDKVQFIPHFPFEKNLKYRARFDPRPLGALPATESFSFEFLIPSEPKAPAFTEVTDIFPGGDLLPENLLRFYVCFSNSMQRGRALEQISLLDSRGVQIPDALYRPPLELWDRSMRRLTVLLDPGRLKRLVGPNRKLGPPLKAGEEYLLEVGSGMIDLRGRPLAACFRKHFLVGEPVRNPISSENWSILRPMADSREALVLMFPSPLDWALLLQAVTIESADGLIVNGQPAADRCGKKWTFTPNSPWSAKEYYVRVKSSLEDVCGNTISGEFDRPLQQPPRPASINSSALVFLPA
jgi:hypothetical protein